RAVWRVEIAKDNGIGRARLLAGRLELSLLNAPILFFRRDARAADALDAIRALLHHPAPAHRHVGVVHRFITRRLVIRVPQEIESPHLIRAVVGTKSRADAAIV